VYLFCCSASLDAFPIHISNADVNDILCFASALSRPPTSVNGAPTIAGHIPSCLKWHSGSSNHLVIISFKDRHRSFLDYHSMAGHNRFCCVIQGRKVAGHSLGVSDLNWHLGALASSKYRDLSLKFEEWFGMYPLTSARAKVVSQEGQSMGASLGD